MNTIVKKECFWVLFLSIGILFLSFLPMYFQYKATPPGTVYLGLHNSLIDFPMFISEISQGQHGKLTLIIKFMTEPQMGTWIHFPNLIFGWISKPFNIHPVLTFHIARAVTGLILLITIYSFIKIFVKNKYSAISIFLLVLLSGPLPHIILESGKFSLDSVPYLSFFTGYDVLKRWTFIPHAMWKDILFFFILIFWIQFWKKGKKKYFFLSIISGFFLGFLSPIHTLIILVSIWGSIPFLIFSKQIDWTKYIKLALSYTIITIPPSIYLYWIFLYEATWVTQKIWESNQLYNLSGKEYILGSGLVFFLSIPVLSLILIKVIRNRFKIFSIHYFVLVIIPITTLLVLFSPFHQLLGTNNMRFLGIPLHVFWSILSGMSVVWFVKKVSERVKNKEINNYLLGLFIMLLIFPTIPTYVASWNASLSEFPTQYYNINPPKDYYDGLLWLRNNTSADDAVFCDFIFCNLVPAYSGNTAYIGHYVATINFAEKKKEVEYFYKTTMSANEAYEFLSLRNIKYVVWSIDEKAYGGDPKKYPFLKLRYKTPLVEIYEIVKN